MTFYYLSKDLELGPPLAVVTLQTTGPAAAVIATMVPNSNSDSDTESSTDESASTSSTDGSTISVPVSAIKPSPPARKPTVSFRHLSFLSVLRQVDPHAAHPRASYRHQFTCLHGAQPSYIIQGPGLQGLYYKRCDGAFVNALGEQLTVPSNVHSSADSSSNTIQPPKQERVTDCTNAAVSQPSINSTAIFDTSLAASPAEIAERAWRRIHTDAGPDAWREVKALKKRAQREERREVREAARMEKRAERERSRQQRREDEGNNEEHRTKLGRAVKEKVRAVGSKCLEKVAFWGA
ncbi:uncharacterized protein HMPREF1541_07514 [Cyphellophora europaea CBS 101466]|uniref:Uncharacterized protein n=1 Tax=Cyphellophora europaea (strain CBS 101466) TaxID=1220924 RepID=W2RN30_CYPE1|nr:uncharacterized protein HMPREF1541_07514 [Cyphellophora europaea CBS 101466]ETN37891.1 hypothetical protein HMPREF1541_07514 [Cyphellophora europaea CBS 101466]